MTFQFATVNNLKSINSGFGEFSRFKRIFFREVCRRLRRQIHRLSPGFHHLPSFSLFIEFLASHRGGWNNAAKIFSQLISLKQLEYGLCEKEREMNGGCFFCDPFRVVEKNFKVTKLSIRCPTGQVTFN